MLGSSGDIPPLPEIGHPESYYAQQAKRADQFGNPHAREAYKVGQYVTLALDPRLDWEKKLRYFQHALRGHCSAPQVARDHVWLFYGQLADLVRRHAGAEALRLASGADDDWAARLRFGTSREQLKGEAIVFFRRLLGDAEKCPEHFNGEDWEQLRILRQQWL